MKSKKTKNKFSILLVKKVPTIFGMVVLFCGMLINSALAQSGKIVDLNQYDKRTAAYYILGQGNLEFYMSEADAREAVVASGMAEENEITERIAEIYIYPSLQHNFLIYEAFPKRFISFNFSTIPMSELLNTMRLQNVNFRIGHLTERRAETFKVLKIPAAEDEIWEVELYFFRQTRNNQDVYRLFGITINLVVGEKVQNMRIANANYVRRTLEEIYKKYKSPTYKRTRQLTKKTGAGLSKTTISFNRLYRTQTYVPNLRASFDEPVDGNFQIATQLNVSYLQYQSDIANLQVNYIATDYIYEVMPEFNYFLSEYDDFLGNEIMGF